MAKSRFIETLCYASSSWLRSMTSNKMAAGGLVAGARCSGS